MGAILTRRPRRSLGRKLRKPSPLLTQLCGYMSCQFGGSSGRASLFPPPPGWGGQLGWASEPGSGPPWAPSSLPWRPHVLPHAFPHSEEEPHAARGEHSPLRENQQLCRGPGPGGGDAAGAHHPRVTVSVRPPGLEGHGAPRGRLAAGPGLGPAHAGPATTCRLPSVTGGHPPAARGRTQCPGTRRGGEQGHFPPSLGT